MHVYNLHEYCSVQWVINPRYMHEEYMQYSHTVRVCLLPCKCKVLRNYIECSSHSLAVFAAS